MDRPQSPQDVRHSERASRPRAAAREFAHSPRRPRISQQRSALGGAKRAAAPPPAMPFVRADPRAETHEALLSAALLPPPLSSPTAALAGGRPRAGWRAHYQRRPLTDDGLLRRWRAAVASRSGPLLVRTAATRPAVMAAADALSEAHGRLFRRTSAPLAAPDAEHQLAMANAVAAASHRLGSAVERQILCGPAEGVAALKPWRNQGCFETLEASSFREHECLAFQSLCHYAAAHALRRQGLVSKIVETHLYWTKIMQAVADPSGPGVLGYVEKRDFAGQEGRVAYGYALASDDGKILLPASAVLELQQLQTCGVVCPMAMSNEDTVRALASSFTCCAGCGRAVQLDTVHMCPVCLDACLCKACCTLGAETESFSPELLRHHASGECAARRARVAALRAALCELHGAPRESALWSVSVGIRLASHTAAAATAATALDCCSLSSGLFGGAAEGLVEQALLHRVVLLMSRPREGDQDLVEEHGGVAAFTQSLWDENVVAEPKPDAAAAKRREKKARRREKKAARRKVAADVAADVVDVVEDGVEEIGEEIGEEVEEAAADVEGEEAAEEAFEEAFEIPECAFCMDAESDSVCIPCGHVGCLACLQKHSSGTCPVCAGFVARIVRPR